MSRRLAEQLLDHARRVMPPADRRWIDAMRAELDHVPGPLAALGFALGCAQASYVQRIHDMLTIARLTRWTLSGLALAWAGFSALALAMLAAVKASPDIQPSDLGTDPGTDVTLQFIQGYPAWELGLLALIAGLLGAGAVLLFRRRPSAFLVLLLGVAAAAILTLIDQRLPDPGADHPFGAVTNLLFPLLCLAPAWWLSRRSPDLKAAG